MFGASRWPVWFQQWLTDSTVSAMVSHRCHVDGGKKKSSYQLVVVVNAIVNEIRRVDLHRPRSTSMFPAHAGMVRLEPPDLTQRRHVPRARGDGPSAACRSCRRGQCSPRTRGWSRPTVTPSPSRRMFPAHAGMVPCPWAAARPDRYVPRARGDGPSPPRSPNPAPRCSPRTRGWSGSLVVTYGDMQCSPRTRGWSTAGQGASAPRNMFPAHAGMVPRNGRTARQNRHVPRARGDGPNIIPTS